MSPAELQQTLLEAALAKEKHKLPQTPKKRKQSRKTKAPQIDIVEQKQNNRGLLTNHDQLPRSSQRRIDRQPVHARRQRDGGSGAQQARPEPVGVGNTSPNKFLNMPERHKHKQDTEWDKRVSGGITPVERRPQIQTVEMQCSHCSHWYEIYLHEAYKDEEGKIRFICDTCSGRG